MDIQTVEQFEAVIASLREIPLRSRRQRWQRWKILTAVRLFGVPTQDVIDECRSERV